MKGKREVRTCNESRAVSSDIVVAKHLNDKETVFGGEIMAHFDSACGNAAYQYLQRPAFTASVEQLQFVLPVYKGDIFYIEAYVSGAGTSSVEVFAKLLAKKVLAADYQLKAFTFMTFVLEDTHDSTFAMPELEPETIEEKIICAGYKERRKAALQQRQENKSLMANINLTPIWQKQERT